MDSKRLSLAALVAALLGTLVSSCVFLVPQAGTGGGDPVQVEEKLLADAPLPRQVEPHALRIFRYAQELPPGFFYARDRERRKLYAMPDYPAPAAPHIIIGALGWRGGRINTIPDEVMERGVSWGGNSLFCPPGENFCYVMALSDEPPGTRYRDYEDLLAEQKALHEGFKPDTRPLRIDLAEVAPITIETTPSHCYVLLFALDRTAALEEASRGLYGELQSGDGLLSNRSLAATETVTTPEGIVMTAPLNGPYAHLRAFSQSLGCALGTGSATLSFYAPARGKRLGKGPAFVQVLTRKISKKELEEKKGAHDRAVEEARRAAEEQRRIDEQRRKEEEERRAKEREEAKRRETERKATKTEAPKASHYSLSLKNNCSRTVRLFIGDKPKYGSGRYTTVSANSISSYSGFAPQTFWIVDDRDNGLSSWVAGPGSHNMQITSSCTGFATR
jgi:hypothetical protein